MDWVHHNLRMQREWLDSEHKEQHMSLDVVFSASVLCLF